MKITRKVGERIIIGDDIIVQVHKICGKNSCKIDIVAPAHVSIVREELMGLEQKPESSMVGNAQCPRCEGTGYRHNEGHSICRLCRGRRLVDEAEAEWEIKRVSTLASYRQQGRKRSRRPPKRLAEKAINKYLADVMGEAVRFVEVTILEDGDEHSGRNKCGWAWWVRGDDTTSYLHEDLSIEFYGSWANIEAIATADQEAHG